LVGVLYQNAQPGGPTFLMFSAQKLPACKLYRLALNDKAIKKKKPAVTKKGERNGTTEKEGDNRGKNREREEDFVGGKRNERSREGREEER